MDKVNTKAKSKPNRKYVDITFWLAQVLIISAFSLIQLKRNQRRFN